MFEPSEYTGSERGHKFLAALIAIGFAAVGVYLLLIAF